MLTTAVYPRLHIATSTTAAVGQADGVLLTETIRATGLDRELSQGLSRWRKPNAVHDPAKVIVALAADAPAALRAIHTARAAARAAAWQLAGDHAPDHGANTQSPLVIDLDATRVTAHSEKELAAPTFKRGFGFHPLCAQLDHGGAGTGEPLAIMLRPGNAGSKTAADHITVVQAAAAQVPGGHGWTRARKEILVRTDGAGGTKALIEYLTAQQLAYSIEFTLPDHTPGLLALTGHEARRWKPKHLRVRLFTPAAVITRTGRRTWLHLNDRTPWAHLAAQGIRALRTQAAPG